ncbi:hypothetical protein [uncultured Tateyamaria sp.]|uniref:hypothetical protein n=1 Tax=uncultured Tateyamaria sp. TaxID=455651 RepID=UPI0026377250|nr:hypothetical protein [uncultured Tateyamaria sp.]
MRIKINHTTKQVGLLFKKTFIEVAVTVLFSHEETQIIRQRNLVKTKLMTRRPATAKVDDHDEPFELKVQDILNGKTDRFLLSDPAAAKRYQETLLETLAQLKLWISDSAELGDDFVVEL